MRRPPRRTTRRRRSTALAGSSSGPTPKPGVVVADAADADDPRAAVDREPHVVDHLPGVLLEHGDGPHAGRRPRRARRRGNGQSEIGRTQPTCMPCARGRRARRTWRSAPASRTPPPPPRRRRAARSRSVARPRPSPVLLGHDLEVLAVTQVDSFCGEPSGVTLWRTAPARAGGGPGLGRQVGFVARAEHDRLRGVAEHEVAQHDDRRCASGRRGGTPRRSGRPPPARCAAPAPGAGSRRARRRASPGSSRPARASC